MRSTRSYYFHAQIPGAALVQKLSGGKSHRGATVPEAGKSTQLPARPYSFRMNQELRVVCLLLKGSGDE